MSGTQWQAIYTDICNVLLEPGGLQLGLYTVDQFLTQGGEVLTDFLSQTGLVKRIWIQQAQAGIATYQESDQMTHLEGVIVNGHYLYRTSEFFLDEFRSHWEQAYDTPASFREDNLPVHQVSVNPLPNLTGNQVTVPAGQGAYGQMSATANAAEFDIGTSAVTPMGFGTFLGFGGNPFVEVTGLGLGVLSTFVPSSGNVVMFASALPSNIAALTLASPIELLPDSFLAYVRFGILAQIYSSDNELKDEQKARYCAARYQEGLILASAMMGGDLRDNNA